jgi:5-hydroxyisourate hydrolase-like protein (transthyretin family)
MSKSISLRVVPVVSLLLLLLVCLSSAEKKKKAPEQFSNLSFVVLKDANGKPVKNASVVVHSVNANGEQEKDGFQLKTDTDGRAGIDDISYGKLRLQVIAHGLQTYGDDVDVNQAQQEFVIRLKPPAAQVSIYPQ